MEGDLIVGVGVGLASGFVYGLIGFFKNRKQENMFEGFDVKKFSTSVLTCTLVGGASFYLGITPDAVTTGAFGICITEVVRKVVGMVFKKK